MLHHVSERFLARAGFKVALPVRTGVPQTVPGPREGRRTKAQSRARTRLPFAGSPHGRQSEAADVRFGKDSALASKAAAELSDGACVSGSRSQILDPPRPIRQQIRDVELSRDIDRSRHVVSGDKLKESQPRRQVRGILPRIPVW